MSSTEQSLAGLPPALRNVPVFPPVAARLMRMFSDESRDFVYKDVADLIRTDAAFSTEILRLANSPLFGFRYQIRDIPHAVAVLGLNRLRAVVTTLAMKEFVSNAREGAALRSSWRHNLATALACETMAPASWLDSGLGYTAGLLHDVGLLALIATHHDAYVDFIGGSSPCSPIEFLGKERALFGLDHCMAGEWLLADWGLPGEFCDAAAHHHLEAGNQTSGVTQLVHLGCVTAGMAGFSVCQNTFLWDPESILVRLPAQRRELYRLKLNDLPMIIATKINSFDCDFLT